MSRVSQLQCLPVSPSSRKPRGAQLPKFAGRAARGRVRRNVSFWSHGNFRKWRPADLSRFAIDCGFPILSAISILHT